MTGAASRRRGANAERMVVDHLRAHGWPDARRYLAGDGRQPGDVDAIPGVVFEVRSRAECKPGSWMADAEAQAGPERLAVVIYHPPGVGDPARWVAMVRAEQLLRLLEDTPTCHHLYSSDGTSEPEPPAGPPTASSDIG